MDKRGRTCRIKVELNIGVSSGFVSTHARTMNKLIKSDNKELLFFVMSVLPALNFRHMHRYACTGMYRAYALTYAYCANFNPNHTHLLE